MELEINQYLAQQREMAGEQVDNRRDRGQDYSWERNQARDRRRHRSRPSRFNDIDDRVKQHSGNYDNAERRDCREQESSRREENYEDRIPNSRFEDRYEEESGRYSRSEDRSYRSRYDERYDENDRYSDRHSDRHSERHSERGDERRGRRRIERNGNRADDDDRYGESRERGGSSKKEKPSRTVMLKGLNSLVTDHDIRTILQMFGAPIKDVRLVKHRDTGASRGFAFVEFQFLPDAQRWMEENQGLVVLGGQETQLVFSSNKDREEDWFCSQCGAHNFKRREYCFKCSISKDDSERYSEIGQVASNVLILMGLDALTTEETVTKVLEYTSSAKMNISIARDSITRTSRGYCYVEMDTVETATHLMNILASMQPPFQIDGKQVSVHFCKQNIPERPEVAAPVVAEPQWPASYGSPEREKPITTPPTVASTAALSYFQHATLDPVRLTTGAQQTPYAYQQYVVQTNATIPAQLTYPTQVLLVSANTAIAPAGQTAVVIPSDRDQYKAAVAQEQVEAARQQQLQQQLQQQIMATVKLQEEVKKQVEVVAVAPAAATAAAAAASAAAAAAAAIEDDQKKLAEQARRWSEKKKEQEQQSKKTSEENKDGAAISGTAAPATAAPATAAPATVKKKKKRKQQEVTQDAPVVVQFFQDGRTYPTPDVSTYQYDEQSGFYYDPTIGLYYDANSQYYYNSDTQSYLYWDAGASTYLLAPDFKPEADQGTAQSELAAGDKNDKTKDKDIKKDNKNDKNKMAKKLVKDMARWAKSMNSSKHSFKKSMGGMEGRDWVAGAADAGFAMLMKKANPADTKVSVQQALQHQTSDPGPGSAKSAIVASYGGGSDSDPEPDSNSTFATINPAAATNNGTSVDGLTDWSKLICLLCKRQFPSKEILVKHQQFSELHKQNLDSLKQQHQESGTDMDGSETDYQYRDRAKERRSKFGVDAEPPKKRFRAPKPTIPYEQPTKAGLKEDNIGNQMLQKMGWNKGTGLGKKQQGRTDPIEVHKRQAGAGLGTKGGSYDLTGSDSYRDAVKKVMRSRFEEME
ncbi:RNA-binding protein 10-like isoform X3 [Asterias rubens]|uniref:RNA-binding protein 10-like isoform X3 n=1 Tax=Asterias rubens TaxID=7604 RepID=UPI00145578FB|nr:RNA-binding protein 10-like isoform X3 [Asterias rubens]